MEGLFELRGCQTEFTGIMNILINFCDEPYISGRGCLALSDEHSIYGHEPIEANAFVRGIRPSELTVRRMIDRYPGDYGAIMSFLSSRAYAYFFPGFMTIALENVDNQLDEEEGGFFIYGRVTYSMYCMATGNEYNNRLDDLVQAYSRDQLRVLALALAEIKRLQVWPIVGEDVVSIALERYWGQYLE